MTDNKNTIIAIALSALVLIVWQYFVGMPQQKVREEQALQQQQKQVQTQPVQPGQPGTSATAPVAGAPTVPGHQPTPAAVAAATRADALKQSDRVPISTGNLKGSIALKGGRTPREAHMHPRTMPRRPDHFELLDRGRQFPPNYLHQSWLDFLYWDIELEP